MFRSAEGGDIRIGAMMVGYYKPAVRDQAAGAVEPDRHNGIRDGRAGSIGVVDLPGGQLEATGLHVLLQGRVDVLDKPHALIGMQRGRKQQRSCDKKEFQKLNINQQN